MHTEKVELKSFVFEQPAVSEELTGHVRGTGPARVKVLNPLSSNGAAMHAEVLYYSPTDIRCRVPRRILVGSTVQVRTRESVAFGHVHSSIDTGADFEIELDVERSA